MARSRRTSSRRPASRRKKVRVAMIGAGSMANAVHYPSLASFDDVEIAAVCDLDEERLTTTADKYDVPRRYTDYRKMIEETVPDAVYAIGQPDQMYDVWLWCLSRGQNLYIEKPMGITLHQARMLAYLADKHNCITQVSFQRRACPLLVHLREECLQRGPIVLAVCEFYKCALRPYLTSRDHMTDDCVHAIDTVRWMCGGEITRIQSRCRRIGVPDINFIAAMLHFDNEATGLVLSSWSSGRRVFRVEMHAPNVYVDAEVEGMAYLYADGDYQGVAYDTREVAGSDDKVVFGGFRAKNREFIDAVKAGRQPSSCFADALKTMEAAERILAQALLRDE